LLDGSSRGAQAKFEKAVAVLHAGLYAGSLQHVGEGIEIGAEHGGHAESVAESSPNRWAMTPRLEGAIGPEDSRVGLKNRDAFAERFENGFVLQQHLRVLPESGIVSGDVRAR
jgi:hypothetical protein